MKRQLADTLYDNLEKLMKEIKTLDEDRMNLAMLFFSEAVRNIATIFNLFDMPSEKFNDLVYNIGKFIDETK